MLGIADVARFWMALGVYQVSQAEHAWLLWFRRAAAEHGIGPESTHHG